MSRVRVFGEEWVHLLSLAVGVERDKTDGATTRDVCVGIFETTVLVHESQTAAVVPASAATAACSGLTPSGYNKEDN